MSTQPPPETASAPPQEENKQQESQVGAWFKSGWAKTKVMGAKAAKSAGDGMKVGMAYAKVKMNKVEASEESQEFKECMENLGKTENLLNNLLRRAKALNRAQQEYIKAQQNFADGLMEGEEDELFTKVCRSNGTDMKNLLNLESDLVEKFQENVIAPLELVMKNEVGQAQQWRKEYKLAKLEYDHALADAEKTRGQPGPKADAAQQKLSSMTDRYLKLQGQLKDAYTVIEAKKNTEIKRCIEDMAVSRKKYHKSCAGLFSDQVR